MKPSSRNPAFKNTNPRKHTPIKFAPLDRQFSSVFQRSHPTFDRVFNTPDIESNHEYPGIQATSGRFFEKFQGTLEGWGEVIMTNVEQPFQWPVADIESYEVSINKQGQAICDCTTQ